MPKRKNTAKATKTTANQLAKALAKRTKGELVDLLLDIANEDRAVKRDLEARFAVEPPRKELIATTRQAIADATDFDPREINYNFDYDFRAYDAVKRNFGRLIATGHLRDAMELSLELMSRGSYQVEMSDEGLMTDDITECLKVVIAGIRKANLPADFVTAWTNAMAKKDRVGFICDKELRILENEFS